VPNGTSIDSCVPRAEARFDVQFRRRWNTAESPCWLQRRREVNNCKGHEDSCGRAVIVRSCPRAIFSSPALNSHPKAKTPRPLLEKVEVTRSRLTKHVHLFRLADDLTFVLLCPRCFLVSASHTESSDGDRGGHGCGTPVIATRNRRCRRNTHNRKKAEPSFRWVISRLSLRP